MFVASKLGALSAEAIGKNVNFIIIFAMRIDIVVLDDVFDLGLSAVLDVFRRRTS
jgi:hypothetical protein